MNEPSHPPFSHRTCLHRLLIRALTMSKNSSGTNTHSHTTHTHARSCLFFRRLGSLFFPNTSIRGDGPRQSSPELYASALQAFGQMTKSSPNISVTEPEYRAGKAVYAQSFERSSVLDLAGQPSSNSRIISLVSRFSDTAVHDSSFYLFFAQLIRVFSSNAVVEQ